MIIRSRLTRSEPEFVAPDLAFSHRAIERCRRLRIALAPNSSAEEEAVGQPAVSLSRPQRHAMQDCFINRGEFFQELWQEFSVTLSTYTRAVGRHGN